METKYCILNYFVTQIFPSYTYLPKFLENFMKAKFCVYVIFE